MAVGNAVTIRTPQISSDPPRNAWFAAAALSTGLGWSGVDWVTTTAAQTGQLWNIFHAVTDCVISSVTYKPGTSTGSPAGLTLKAGDRIYGWITGLTLTSGAGELYRANNQL